MELLNATKMTAGYTMGLRPDGRELLVVVIKGTFTIPTGNRPPELAEQQADLVMADEFTSEPGSSAPKYESDFAPFKPRCDVLLNGSAYAPGGRPATRVNVGLRVGTMIKSFSVVGHREWKMGWFFVHSGRAAPFTVMPISYDNAFGGVDKSHPDKGKHRTFVPNHVGRGFQVNLARDAIAGKPLPNTEEIGQKVTNPRGKYRPMAFGSIARVWSPRPKFAGTYDQNWQDNVFPFLPADFDERYNQAAPLDQQIDHLRGGEDVVLLNLTPQGKTNFNVPKLSVPVTFHLKNGEEIEAVAANDTIIIEPDLGRFILLWRSALPLKRNMFEVSQVVVGRMSRAWYRARALGKTWYPSLKDLVNARMKEKEEAVDEEVEKTEEVEI
jgi:hypothetical protein